MSSSGLNNGDFSRLDVAYDLGVGTNRNTGIAGQVLTSGGSTKSMTWGSTGISEVIAGDGIVITSTTNPAGDKEKIVKTHIDNDTITYKTGSPTKIFQVAKVPNALTFGAGLSASVGTTYDGSQAITLTGTANDHVVVSAVGQSATLSTFTLPLTNVNPATNTGMTGIAGLGIENLTAVATTYDISLTFQLTRDAFDATRACQSVVRLDRMSQFQNQGWTTANGVSGPIILMENRTANSLTNLYYNGKLTYKWVVNNLTIGTAYNFIPRWTTYTGTSTANTTPAQIQYGGNKGAITIVATPIDFTTPTNMAEQNPSSESEEEGGV
tara:strand:+ start:2572 stop:3546 length:975 start_codon:yes stop_codon:yes gene_type:complete